MALEPIVIKRDASAYKCAYSLTWNWDGKGWIEKLEPERGEATGYGKIHAQRIREAELLLFGFTRSGE